MIMEMRRRQGQRSSQVELIFMERYSSSASLLIPGLIAVNNTKNFSCFLGN